MRARRVLPYALSILAAGVVAAVFGGGSEPPSRQVTSSGGGGARTSPSTSTSSTSTTEVTKVTVEVAPPGDGDPGAAPDPAGLPADAAPPAADAVPELPPVPTGPAGPDAAPAPAPGDPVQVVMRGRVTSPGGQPVAGLCVVVMPAPTGGPIPEGLTGDDGRYEVVYRGPSRGPNPRSWNVGVRECSNRTPAYRSEWIGDAFNVPVGGTATVDGVVARPASVSGTVSDPDGRPLQGYCVTVLDGYGRSRVRTGADGTYAIAAANAASDVFGSPGCTDDGSARFDVLATTPPDGGHLALDVTVPRPDGDDIARPAELDGRYWNPFTMTADRRPDEPRPTCAADALGGVWMSLARVLPEQLSAAGHGALAVYVVDDAGSLVEIGCWRLASDTNQRYEIVGADRGMVLQFAGTAPDSYGHVEI